MDLGASPFTAQMSSATSSSTTGGRDQPWPRGWRLRGLAIAISDFGRSHLMAFGTEDCWEAIQVVRYGVEPEALPSTATDRILTHPYPVRGPAPCI